MNNGISDTVLREIRDSAVRNNLSRVVLFGSRARGDYKSRSDIDLAVSGGNVPQFWSDMDDASTLMSFDIVNLDKPVQQALLDSILREGYSIYEKS